MTSPGRKRSLDLEMPSRANGPNDSSSSSSPTLNGSKRRCTNPHTSRMDSQNFAYSPNKSPFGDYSRVLSTLSSDISDMIQSEIRKQASSDGKSNDNNTNNNNNDSQQQPQQLLTISQTQIICERIINDRESKIRDEYDRILACKLAEQYDLLTKANYLKSLDTRLQQTAALLPPTNPSLSALAAAYTSIQRSASVAAAAAISNHQANQLPDLSTFASSLTANSHPSNLATSHLAYNLHQQAANHASTLQQQQQQQQRNLVAAQQNIIPSGPVLLVSNLDEQLAIPEALFTLFGVFGDVIRVKILYNKKDNALIQMADANQAQVAQSNLDKQKVFGKTLRVTRSKHLLVQMPRDGNQSDAGLTKDFTNSPLHRFKIPGSRNYLNIYPPSNTLHISNIPATIDEKEIQKAFKDACGFECSSFKFFLKDRKMAIMRFDTIENATIALIKMHNYQIGEENKLRVSFSKSAIQQ